MALKISRIRPASDGEWDAIWRKCEYATFFHSRLWAETWRAFTGGVMNPSPLLVEFDDGKKALLPLSFQRHFKGLVKRYISSPGGTFGGWITADELGEAHAARLGRFLTKKTANLVWRLNPYDKLVTAAGITGGNEEQTQVLDLERGFDKILKNLTKGHYSAAKKAGKAGVIIKQAATLDEWQLYYEVYEDSLRRWGQSTTSYYDWELFHYMYRLNSPCIKLWLALYKDEVAAGALCFYAKNHVVYWHGAALEKFFKFKPVNLLIVKAIKHACDNGYKWFDFNPSGNLEGVRKFKKSFGTQEMNCPVITFTSWTSRLLSIAARLKG
jgi:hypothetical protein